MLYNIVYSLVSRSISIWCLSLLTRSGTITDEKIGMKRVLGESVQLPNLFQSFHNKNEKMFILLLSAPLLNPPFFLGLNILARVI